jgi:hypothetical protein
MVRVARWLLAPLLATACTGARRAPPQPGPEPAPAARAALACTEPAGFPSTLDVPEASAAPLVDLPDGEALLVVSDSGNGGEALVVPTGAGAAPRKLVLPLDRGASDDLEGAAFADGRLYTLTSSGAVRAFVFEGGEARRLSDAYRLGPEPASCGDLGKVNCGRNYESLCLRRTPVAGRPRGWAASKEESRFYPLAVDAAGRLLIDASFQPITVAVAPRSVSDCTFAPTGELLVVTNVHDGNRTFVLDEATGEARVVDVPGLLNLEAVGADAAGHLYLFSDTNGRPSAARRFACTGWAARADAGR